MQGAEISQTCLRKFLRHVREEIGESGSDVSSGAKWLVAECGAKVFGAKTGADWLVADLGTRVFRSNLLVPE